MISKFNPKIKLEDNDPLSELFIDEKIYQEEFFIDKEQDLNL